jgi:hypothetical protein
LRFLKTKISSAIKLAAIAKGKMIVDIDTLEGAKVVLIWLYVLSTIGVIVGVYLEGERFSDHTKLVGWRILLCSLAVETLFGTLIFAADGKISKDQRYEIIALQTKLAPRSLNFAQMSEISAALAKFSGQEFTIGSYGGEPELIAIPIRAALEQANWKWFDPEFHIVPLAGTVGIQVWASTQGSRLAAQALVGALADKDIAATLLPKELPAQPNTDKIEMIVGSKF